MESGMGAWLERIPLIDLALIGIILLAALIAVGMSRRGGRFRTLPGWAMFWAFFGTILACLSHAPRGLSFALLALLMYVSLRDYFFVAPVRPRDRYVILASYVAIPVALYPAYIGSTETFLATVPVAICLFIPAFLAIGSKEEGMLDSTGRALLGLVFFIFCTAHLALLAGKGVGMVELFGVLVLASDIPQRLSRDFTDDKGGWIAPAVGVVIGMIAAVSLGFFLGPEVGLVEEDGARAGFFVGLAVALGSRVGRAVATDLDLKQPMGSLTRSAFLDRLVPAVYAAPVMFHYLNHFA